jgi:hypothetical protein
MTRSKRCISKRPLAQAKGTHQQSTNEQRLMEPINALDMLIMVFITLIVRVAAPNSNLVWKTSISQTHSSRGSLPPVSLAQQQQSVTTLLRGNLINTGSIRILHRDFAMPRIRGKPRRGAAWYAAESRRKRKKDFEKAMAIVARRRRTRSRLPPKEQGKRSACKPTCPAIPGTPCSWH